jgi:hypothetical protein
MRQTRRGAPRLARSIEAALASWTVPRVSSEKALDRRARDLVRKVVQQHVPALPAAELSRWVAGHHDADKRAWAASKPHQNIRLWGAGKTADVFVYHPDGCYGLPTRGISVEVKYVRRGGSYAGAIATVAGQLLAYAVRHERTIGFVWCDGRRRRIRPEEHARAFLALLPANARLLVRFRKD